MGWTLKHIKQLKADKKIRGFEMTTEKFVAPVVGGKKVGKHFKRKSAGLDFIAKNLFFWCQSKCLVLEEEYRFHVERKWRFDWAIVSLKTAIEFEGGVHSADSGHKTAKHYTKDTEKYNSAALLGWKVLRFTALNYQNLLTELNKLKINNNDTNI